MAGTQQVIPRAGGFVPAGSGGTKVTGQKILGSQVYAATICLGLRGRRGKGEKTPYQQRERGRFHNKQFILKSTFEIPEYPVKIS
jgi:hypothetical protein